MLTTKSASFEIRSARIEDMPGACRLMWRSYIDIQDQIDSTYFEGYHLHDPSFEPEQLRILWSDGSMAATVRVFFREVWDGQNHQLIGGIGNVATHPDFRGKGLASMLIADAIEQIVLSGAIFSTLYTAIVGLYEKFGFEHHPRATVTGEVTGNVAGLRGSKDYKLAEAIYEECSRHSPGTFKRSGRYWDMWIGSFRLKAASVVYNDAGDTYVVCREDPTTGSIRIVDGGCTGDTESLCRLIRSAFSGRQVGVYDVEKSHALAYAVAQSVGHPRIEPERHLMVLPLDTAMTPLEFHETEIDQF